MNEKQIHDDVINRQYFLLGWCSVKFEKHNILFDLGNFYFFFKMKPNQNYKYVYRFISPD